MKKPVYVLPREIIVVISSPGDVCTERDMVDRVVDEVDAFTRHLGITSRSWRYERDATADVNGDPQRSVTAQMPRDYDVYVGVMCRRLGTPTDRAASGTVEEFEIARRRKEATGRPAVFFYFCQDDMECTDDQAEAVRQFRAEYPGIFREFVDEGHFASLLKHDLLLWLFRTVLGPVRDSTSAAPAEADVHLPSLGPIYEVLAHAFDLRQTLTSLEYAVLTELAQCVSRTDSIPATSQVTVRGREDGLDADWLTSILDCARTDGSLMDFERPREGVRGDLIVALLRIGRALVNNRGFAGDNLPSMDAAPEDWICYFTREVRVSPGGFAQFVLEVPAVEWVTPLKKCTSLRLERTWQDHRHILIPARINLSVEPSEIVLLQRPLRLPGNLLSAVEQRGECFAVPDARVEHLGDECPIPLEHLLPMPGTAIVRPVEFRAESDRPHFLIVSEASGSPSRMELPPAGAIQIGPEALAPGLRYDWRLVACSRTGDERTIRQGWIQRLEQTEEALVAASTELPDEVQLALWQQLGLHDEVLGNLWPRLGKGTAPMEHARWASRLLIDALDFSLSDCPDLTQVDNYRTAAGWLQTYST